VTLFGLIMTPIFYLVIRRRVASRADPLPPHSDGRQGEPA
jgi:hypothetical protein